VETCIKKAAKLGEKVYHIGEIIKGRPGVKYVEDTGKKSGR